VSGGDVFAISWRIAAAVGIPLFAAAYLTTRLDPTAPPWLSLIVILVGLLVAGVGMYLVLRSLISEPPVVTDAARKAGRRWEAEIQDEERRREAEREER